jgi:hypothetical protein
MFAPGISIWNCVANIPTETCIFKKKSGKHKTSSQQSVEIQNEKNNRIAIVQSLTKNVRAIWKTLSKFINNQIYPLPLTCNVAVSHVFIENVLHALSIYDTRPQQNFVGAGVKRVPDALYCPKGFVNHCRLKNKLHSSDIFNMPSDNCTNVTL